MSQRVYRGCRAIHARLDGEGAKRAGGRWNSPGRRMVYTSQSIALAVLENLVHMSRVDFPVGYVSVSAQIPDVIETLSEENLRTAFPSFTNREIGDRWLDSMPSAVLRVPSVVVSGEFNFLLNPDHPDFQRIVVYPPEPFLFDDRLFG